MITTPRMVLDQLTVVLVATGANLRPCSYRRPIEAEPVGGSHRRFEILFVGGRPALPGTFGSGLSMVDLDLSVRVAYARLGGGAGGGSRKDVNSQAGEDSTLISDALTDERNWSRDATGIRFIRLESAATRVSDSDHAEVYESRFRVQVLTNTLQWENPMPSPIFYVDTIADLRLYPVAPFQSGKALGLVGATQRTYLLVAYTGGPEETENNTIVNAVDGRQFILWI